MVDGSVIADGSLVTWGEQDSVVVTALRYKLSSVFSRAKCFNLVHQCRCDRWTCLFSEMEQTKQSLLAPKYCSASPGQCKGFLTADAALRGAAGAGTSRNTSPGAPHPFDARGMQM